jgi:DnaJ-domain-containing protein 1
MARIVAFCVIAPFALMEMLLYHRYDVVILGALYLGMSIQADYAAARLMELNAKKKHRHWNDPDSDEEEELLVRPLGEKPKQDTTYYPPPPVRPEPQALPPPERRQAPPRAERRKAARGFSSLPNFHGRAHEILGVTENAATRTIVHAFRHWIKQFHPDQAQQIPVEVANAKVRQLTDAKQLLLERRRGHRPA